MTVTYTASCPTCGADATWTAWVERVVIGCSRSGDAANSEITSHRIDCQECP